MLGPSFSHQSNQVCFDKGPYPSGQATYLSPWVFQLSYISFFFLETTAPSPARNLRYPTDPTPTQRPSDIFFREKHMSNLHGTLRGSLVRGAGPLWEDIYLPLDALNSTITLSSVNAEIPMSVRLLSPGLAGNIVQHAKKLFAILCLVGESRHTKTLIHAGLVDDDLPLVLKTQVPKTIVTSARSKDFLCFASWPPNKLGLFLNTQWMLLAPTFEGTGRHITIEEQYPLPFRQVERLSWRRPGRRGESTMKVAIHKAHLAPPTVCVD